MTDKKSKPVFITKNDFRRVPVIYACPCCHDVSGGTLKYGDNFCPICGLEVQWSKELSDWVSG